MNPKVAIPHVQTLTLAAAILFALALLFPMTSTARSGGKSTLCLANLHILGDAWLTGRSWISIMEGVEIGNEIWVSAGRVWSSKCYPRISRITRIQIIPHAKARRRKEIFDRINMIFRMNRISNRVHTEWKPQNILTGMDRIYRINGITLNRGRSSYLYKYIDGEEREFDNGGCRNRK